MEEIANLDTYQVRKEQVSERLQKREEIRVAELEKKRLNELKTVAVEEQNIYFTAAFSKAKQQIEEKLAETKTLAKSALLNHFDNIAKDYQCLQKFVADSTLFLPSYDIRIAQENLKILQELIQAKQDEYLPKKKFAFRSKKIISKGKDKVDFVKPKNTLSLSAVDIDIFECGFNDLANQTLVMESEEVNGKNIGLYNLDDCVVQIFGSPNTVHINNLKNCTVLTGPISTSVFIENCSNCTFVIACQQARIHSTTGSNFFLHVSTRAIIEDSKDIKFAPYNWDYPNIDKHFELAKLDKHLNNWNNIDDFNWLVMGVHSPNWSELPETERITEW